MSQMSEIACKEAKGWYEDFMCKEVCRWAGMLAFNLSMPFPAGYNCDCTERV